MDSAPHDRSTLVKRLATEAGFDLVGIAGAGPSRWADAFRQWVASGQHGAMSYLAHNVEDRVNIHRRFPWARSVVAVGLAYWQEDDQAHTPASDAHIEHDSAVIGPAPQGRIARYAWGRDYHRVIGNKLEALEKSMRSSLAPLAFEARTYTDTGPLMDREWAVRAGLGWMGKNTLLINPRHGSWFLLGELITSLDLTPDEEVTDHCGTCTRCIDNCPTDAITPYHVDATRCISYHTLENRGEIPADLQTDMARAGFIVGCDICQEVCPHNHAPLLATEGDFSPRTPARVISLPQVLSWTEHDWDVATRGRAHRRARHEMWQRNARILMQEHVPKQ